VTTIHINLTAEVYNDTEGDTEGAFLKALEQVLGQFCGENWLYTFKVED